MTALLAILIGIAGILYAIFGDRKPAEPPVSRTFTAAVKYGQIQVVVHYESTPNPIEPRAERIIRLWALDREERRVTGAFQLELESELQKYFPAIEVTSITTLTMQEEVVTPETPTRAERVKAALISDADTVQEIGDTINELRESRKDLWDNRKYPGTDKPIGHHLNDKADSLIRTVLHGSKR